MSEQLKTISKMFQLLNLFSSDDPMWTIAGLTRVSGYSRTAVNRIISTLVHEGYLEQCEDASSYRIGISACRLGALYANGSPVLQAAQPPLRRLAQNTGYPVYMGTLSSADIVIMCAFEGTRNIRFTWSVGDRLPVSTTALGKAMLMAMPLEQVEEIISSNQLSQLTKKSLASRTKLQAQLDEQRSAGWIVARDESLEGVTAVGVAIRRPDGLPIAGISVSLVSETAESDRLENLGMQVVRAAAEIEERHRLLVPYSVKSTGNLNLENQ